MNAPRHDDVLNMIELRCSGPVMNNVYRGDYVECMIAWSLGDERRLTGGDPAHLSVGHSPCASTLNAVTPPHLLQSSPALRRPVERDSAEYG